MTVQSQDQNDKSLADYQDLDLVGMQAVADYVMKNSIPHNLTIGETQYVVQCLMDLVNASHHNLNLLRNLAGDGDLQIPVKIGGQDNDA